MTLLEQTRPQLPVGRLRRVNSLLASAMLHGSILAWVALGPLPHEDSRSLYEQSFQGHEHRIVWYNLRDKLPDVTPAHKPADPRPPRAEVKRPQIMVSEGPRKAAQTIWLPEPHVEAPAELPSPNLLAFAPPARPVRSFTPPEARPRTPDPPKLPEAPQLASASLTPAPVQTAVAKPQPRAFTPPSLAAPAVRSAPLPEAPQLASVSLTPAPVQTAVTKPQPRAFTPPSLTAARVRSAPLPSAPEMTVAMNLAGAATPLMPALPVRPGPRTFIPPANATHGPNAAPALPAAPEIAGAANPAAAPAGLPQPAARPAPRAFTPPTSAASGTAGAKAAPLPAAPEMAASSSALPSAAIVGLKPASIDDVPLPEGSRSAQFAAGPQLRANGGTGSGSGSRISVPGLLVRGGAQDAQPTMVARVLEAPTSTANLMAAARAIPHSLPEGAPPSHPRAVQVSSAPDPRLEGRLVYTIAVQMPNITSYSGSWILWFAEHVPVPGQPPDMTPPLPLRKVDPKYPPAAMDERVEGKVRLLGVIRKSGRVDSVALIQGLDTRLDQAAAQAFAKWEFEPALRNGVPVDVDAVVDIPFRLAPKIAK